ncbi:MAG: hypothetical protein II670_06345 [Alphaproteobacteria bacterium]|nr:hypothetical protein [Alphaproteobacteria bacterium]
MTNEVKHRIQKIANYSKHKVKIYDVFSYLCIVKLLCN